MRHPSRGLVRGLLIIGAAMILALFAWGSHDYAFDRVGAGHAGAVGIPAARADLAARLTYPRASVLEAGGDQWHLQMHLHTAHAPGEVAAWYASRSVTMTEGQLPLMPAGCWFETCLSADSGAPLQLAGGATVRLLPVDGGTDIHIDWAFGPH